MCFLNLEKHILRQASVTPAYTHTHTLTHSRSPTYEASQWPYPSLSRVFDEAADALKPGAAIRGF